MESFINTESFINKLQEIGIPGIGIIIIISLPVVVKAIYQVLKSFPDAMKIVEGFKGDSPERTKRELAMLHAFNENIDSDNPMENGYIEVQRAKFASRLAKKATGFCLSLSIRNALVFLICIVLGLFFFFMFMQYSSEPGSNQTDFNLIAEVISLILSAFFFIFACFAEACILFEIFALSPITTYKRRRNWKKSKKENYALPLNVAEDIVFDMHTYTLFDCRAESEKQRIPLKGSISFSALPVSIDIEHAPTDMKCIQCLRNQLKDILDNKCPIFVCSHTGKQSFNVVGFLRNIGYKNVYDIGGVVMDPIKYQRFAWRLHFLYGSD